MKTNLWHFLGFLAVLVVTYYIQSLETQCEEQRDIISTQRGLIETQDIYIQEVNKILGINAKFFYIPNKQDDSPVHKDPV